MTVNELATELARTSRGGVRFETWNLKRIAAIVTGSKHVMVATFGAVGDRDRAAALIASRGMNSATAGRALMIWGFGEGESDVEGQQQQG